MAHRYEVLSEKYWDGSALRNKGEVIESEKEIRISKESPNFTPSLKALKGAPASKAEVTSNG